MTEHLIVVRGKALTAFSFNVDEHLPEFLCPWLSDWLKEHIESGAEFRDGQTLQFGCWLLLCRVVGTRMRLLGPDVGSTPIEWVDNVSVVLRSMMAHKYIPESYGLTMDVPCITDTATVGRDFDKFPMFINRMDRVENGADSGWFFGSSQGTVDNNDPSQLSVVSLYEAILRAPWIHNFLSLPKETQVVFEDEAPVVLRNYEPVKALAGSYMEMRLAGLTDVQQHT